MNKCIKAICKVNDIISMKEEKGKILIVSIIKPSNDTEIFGVPLTKTHVLYKNIEGLEKGCMVFISGTEGVYNGNKLISPRFLCQFPDDFDINPFLKRNVDKEDKEFIISEIMALPDNFRDTAIALIGMPTFNSKRFNEFCTCPAGTMMHNNFTGGTLLHVKGVLILWKMIKEGTLIIRGYSLANLNDPYMRTSLLLHDVGKTKSYYYEDGEGFKLNKLFAHHEYEIVKELETINSLYGFLNEKELNSIKNIMLETHNTGRFSDESKMVSLLDSLESAIEYSFGRYDDGDSDAPEYNFI